MSAGTIRYIFCFTVASLTVLLAALGGAPGWFAGALWSILWWQLLIYTRSWR